MSYPNPWPHVYERNPASVYNWCVHCSEKEDARVHINWRARGITEEQMRKEGYLMNEEERIEFETGSKRNKLDDVRYDLISPIGLRRLAETYALGAAKYTDRNWELGQPFSVLLNHALDHINEFIALQRGITNKSQEASGMEPLEDHLAHAAWNLFALMHFQETMPALNDLSATEITVGNLDSNAIIAEHLSKHYFSGDVGGLCEACKMSQDHLIHYQSIERSTEAKKSVPSGQHSFSGDAGTLCSVCGYGVSHGIHYQGTETGLSKTYKEAHDKERSTEGE